jgi:predicted nucleic acid-binding protein
MASSVYIETTIPSYLTAWRSPELSMAAKQQTTRQWWDEQRLHFDLFISDAVLLEASGGDPDAAKRRLEVLDGIPVLNPLFEADEIVMALIDRLSLPSRALTDAAHIAICIVHGIDYLLTWNCTHIANATFQPIIHDVCDDFGFSAPVICTPDQLMGDDNDS